MALAHAAGIALPLLGADPSPALLLPATVAALFWLWHRPWPGGVLLVAAVAGVVSGSASVRAGAADCRLHLPLRWEGTVEGRFLTRPGEGSTYPFRIEAGAPAGCLGTVRALPARTGSAKGGLPVAGERVRVAVRWEGRRFPEPGRSEWAGLLFLESDWEPAPGGGFTGSILALRGRVQERLAELFDERAPLAEALVLARTEHLDPGLRDAFAVTGTAHILSISGFHVGVVAGLLVGLLRWMGLARRPAEIGAVAGCWAYVLSLGAPHAAVRAALLFTFFLGSRFRGHPVVAAGALSSVLLVLLVAYPEWLGSIGFQLSIAGTAGLILLRKPVDRTVAVVWRWTTGRPLPGGRDRGIEARILKGGVAGIGAGIAATLPTLPLVAWHFDRASLLGIPATLAVAPPLSAAIPGIAASLLLSVLPGPLGGLGAFLAGGTGLVIGAVEKGVFLLATLPGASFWVSRPTLVLALAGGAAAHVVLRRRSAGLSIVGRRVRPSLRRAAVVAWAAALVALVPVLPAPRYLDVHMIDVGQGDALALEFPGRRWVVVDAGPRSDGYDAGARRVVPYLKRWGARRVEVLILTHPHLDHIGGAGALLEEFPVRGVLDPARAYPSAEYVALLETAAERGVPWWTASSGRSFRIGEARLTVLSPGASQPGVPDPEDPNDVSVVLLVEWEDATLLLTGDAPASVEAEIQGDIETALSRASGGASAPGRASFGSLTLLKLGHHGSRTSTSSTLIEVARPRVAVAGVGEGNGFGHPHPEVTDRLEAAGVPFYRTDRDGDIRFRVRADGSFEVRTAR